MSEYRQTYEAWKADPEGWWMERAKAIEWETFPTTACDEIAPNIYRWFPDGTLNTCHNCVDRHVEGGRADQAAVIYDSPITGAKETITYAQLRDRVAAAAGALAERGVGKGDRVIVYMPMIPEAVVAMLACARLGAVHSVVFGGFASHELAVRIDDCKPKAILAASCGIEAGRVVPYMPLLEGALEEAEHAVDFCLVKQREQRADLKDGRDVDWDEAVGAAEPVGCTPVGGADPLYILYTSGTTGRPKGVVRTNGGHAVALHWSMKAIYGVEPGEVYWAASDVGWVVGHSYIVYAPLLHGNTTVLFEGKPVGTPDAGTFRRVIEEHGVVSFFTAPTALRAIKRVDPDGEFVRKHDLSKLRAQFLAGERADPPTVEWAREKLGVPVIDHWWQTETGWTVTGNTLGLGLLDVPTGSAGAPMPGYDIRILDEGGNEVEDGQLGAICVKLPMPPSCLPTLWEADDRYRESYLKTFPGYYETGDAGKKDAAGFLYIMARTDDVINVAGHRLSTGAMEEVLAGHANVAECAVIGVADELKGQLPLGFVCLTDGVNRPHGEVEAECVQRVRDEIGPVAAFKLCKVVQRLPKTRSGKILRATMVSIADGTEWRMPAIIDDPAILEEIGEALRGLGYAKDG